ncbi:GNAT family N-acetyltransferase [Nocardia altamirensis]|uniref:GNAT family N-acetyltransferase n=1 Tax=Nocardia altamirensis TaxID=472158 RepID=UPI0008408150|nr:GNAT family N-acetyltransferase [Nocardia altamirensis]
MNWRITPLAAEYTYRAAECHIACWREAYRGLVPAQLLDAFDVDRRAEQWERQLRKYPDATWVAVVGDQVIGFATASATRDIPPVPPMELNAMYVRSQWYGTGVAHDLLNAAVDPQVGCSLWVFEENPRAQSFYRKHGFELDGARKVEAFTPAIQVRMVREPGVLR